jgi:5S rRNA maturation endonuclease (ribonuclease M5)
MSIAYLQQYSFCASMGDRAYPDGMCMDALRAKMKALQRLKETLSKSDCAILVEGKHDKRALIRAGFMGANVIAVSGRKPEKIVESLAYGSSVKRVVILMDFDESGRKLAKRWAEALCGYDLRIDSEVPRKMRWVFGIKTVEDLPTALEKFEEKCNRCTN